MELPKREKAFVIAAIQIKQDKDKKEGLKAKNSGGRKR